MLVSGMHAAPAPDPNIGVKGYYSNDKAQRGRTVQAAIVMEKTGLGRPQALKRLRSADDSVRDAIGEDIEPRLRQLLGSR